MNMGVSFLLAYPGDTTKKDPVDSKSTQEDSRTDMSITSSESTCRAFDYKDAHKLPIVVDLDGTLTPTDTLIESLIKLVKQSPINLMRLPLWLLKSRAGFKASLAAHVSFSAIHLPYCEPLLAYLREEKAKGRSIILATAAHKSIAEAVSTHLGLFDKVLATEAGHNLKGKAKLQAIEEKVGKEFVYCGDSYSDLPIWEKAQAGILVGVSSHLAETVRRKVHIEREFPKEGAGLALWVQAFRVHQWLKNILLFVPVLTSFSFMKIAVLCTMTMAFLSFSFATSAIYILNDLSDLENDRAHPRKRLRPFASAKLPILHGVSVAGIALVLASIIALVVSKEFFLMLLLYLALSSAYTLLLKKYIIVDVLILSLFYILRILAGSTASGVVTSSWLLAFSFFIFMSLALVKRCAELVSLKQQGKNITEGRNYYITDLVVLWPMGIGAAMSAVVIFGLFISAPETKTHYATPDLLWLVAICLIYWLARIWVKTSRGEMDDDPVLYSIKDKNGLVIVFIMVIIILIAHFLTFGSSL
jgi:4-hydroxybenzoate polyprenyltransferase/phosphoserine phosphatase